MRKDLQECRVGSVCLSIAEPTLYLNRGMSDMPMSTKLASVRNELFTRPLRDQVSRVPGVIHGSISLLSFTRPPPDPPFAGHSRSPVLRRNHALETFEIICNRLSQCKKPLKKFLRVTERHAQRARLKLDPRRQPMYARIQHSRLHRDLHACGNSMSLHPFHGFFKTHSASSFLMKAIAVLQHLQLLDQPRAVHQEGMAGLLPPSACMN